MDHNRGVLPVKHPEPGTTYGRQKGRKIVNDCWDSRTQFSLSSAIEAAGNRLELALGRKQPSTRINHLGLKK
jgi:hypothetical protein